MKAYATDGADKEKWEKAGVKMEGGYDDFFAASDFVMVGTPGDEELPYVEAALATTASYLSWAEPTGPRFKRA